MRVVVQRVKHAMVSVNDKLISQINKGFLLLVAVSVDDREEDINYCAKKVAKLRVFDDEDGKLNQDISQINGSILSVSQFTLYGSVKKGNRPSFIQSASGDKAMDYYKLFNDQLRQYGIQVKEGLFGEYMNVRIDNDGPVTIIIDSKE